MHPHVTALSATFELELSASMSVRWHNDNLVLIIERPGPAYRDDPDPPAAAT